MKCNYCNKEAEWVDNKEIYGKSYGKSHKIWLCRPCDAYVGCHQNSKRPFGTLANRELRSKRIIAKTLFKNKYIAKYGIKNAYVKLSNDLKIKEKDCHFGMFDIEMCNKFINITLPSKYINQGIKIWNNITKILKLLLIII